MFQLDAVVFGFLTRTNQNQSGTTEWPAVERRQDQHKLKFAAEFNPGGWRPTTFDHVFFYLQS